MSIFRSAGCVLLNTVFSTRCCGCGPKEPVCSLVHCVHKTPAVLLKMGIQMPEICRDVYDNKSYNDHKTNNSIRKELRITSILDKIDEYRKKWLLHILVQRMPQNRIPLKSYNYRPQGRRSIGRPKKHWREQL